MADVKLFSIQPDKVEELASTSVQVEKSLQTLFEKHLEGLVGVRLLGSEYVTGKVHGGRIDTLGIDENAYPVIIEYKRAVNENVVSQGLYYLDWLLDHKAEFKLLVLEKFGAEAASKIEWSAPRLICVAGDFTKYDEHAVKQINRTIELIRYRRYGEGLLLLELVNATNAGSGLGDTEKLKNAVQSSSDDSVSEQTDIAWRLSKADKTLQDLFLQVRAFLLALGDDVQVKELQLYIAFKRIKNFACLEIHPTAAKVVVFVKVDPDSVVLEQGFTRDVRQINHWGTGDLEITIRNPNDLAKAQPLLVRSYEGS